MIMWLVPEAIKNIASEPFLSALRQYVVITIAHLKVSDRAEITFKIPEGVVIQTGDSNERQTIPETELSPFITDLMAKMRSEFLKGFGLMGQNMRWYFFDGDGIESCKNGGFWVGYGGVRYEYETPIPGCP